MEDIIYILFLTIGASFVQRTTGFGFGIFIMTFLPFLMPSYGEATALSGLLAMTTSAIIAIKLRKFVNWKSMWPILAAFSLISTIAICFLSQINDNALRKILGLTLIFLGIWFAFFKEKTRIGTTLPWQIGAGSVSGLMGGFFGMHGPPAALYFISSSSSKEQYIAMTQVYFVASNIIMTVVRGANGFITINVAKCWLICLAGVGVGTLLGSWAFKHLPNKTFPYIIYSFISISGLIIFITS